MTEHLDEARRAVEDRLSTLRDEVKRLEAAAAALGGSNGGSARRGPGRPRGSSSRSSSSASRPRRRGRPRGSGTRALQAEKIVRDNPGISIADLAKRMNIKPNYLYRVMPQLRKDGKVRKQGGGWHGA